eukprot:7314654-Heterocapsa_arctica.AAC.1
MRARLRVASEAGQQGEVQVELVHKPVHIRSAAHAVVAERVRDEELELVHDALQRVRGEELDVVVVHVGRDDVHQQLQDARVHYAVVLQ